MDNVVEYDLLEAPEPEEWLAIDEPERIRLALDYHRRARVRLPNEKLHAVLHVVIENQIALGDEIPVQNTAQRLMAERRPVRGEGPRLHNSQDSCRPRATR